jgi:dipeptide/tripeptide permease
LAGFVNHHSFLIFGGLLFLIWAGVLLVRRARRAWIIWGLALLLLGAGWLLLRTRQAKQPATLAEIEAVLASGQPVLVEIYSDY